MVRSAKGNRRYRETVEETVAEGPVVERSANKKTVVEGTVNKILGS